MSNYVEIPSVVLSTVTMINPWYIAHSIDIVFSPVRGHSYWLLGKTNSLGKLLGNRLDREIKHCHHMVQVGPFEHSTYSNQS